MASHFQLADTYDSWATQDEAFAARILAGLHQYPDDVRERHVGRAVVLLHQAQAFRKDALSLRFAGPITLSTRVL